MKSIYFKNFLATAVMVLVSFLMIGVAFVFIGQGYVIKSHRESMEQNAKTVTRLVVSMLATDRYIDAGYLRVMLTFTESISGNQVFLTDAEGYVFSCSDEIGRCQHIGNYVPEYYINTVNRLGKLDTTTDLDGLFSTPRYVFAMPLTLTQDSEPEGYIFVSTDKSTIMGAWSAFIWVFFAVTLAVLFLALVLSLVVSKKMAEPLDEMTAAARRFAHGDFSVRVREDKGTDELAALTSSFNNMADSLERSEQQRNEFIANVSHELKTPLAAIRLLTDSILQNERIDPETTREFVSDIGQEADRLQRITEDLLRLTRLDSGEVEAPSQIQVQPVLERVLRMLRPVAEDKEVSLRSAADSDAVVLATVGELHQILYNLVENGVKYNRRGGFVRVSTELGAESTAILVEDNGIGIPQEELKEVFKRFYRVDKARSRAAGGTGLGLSIVRDTVSRRGGTVWAEAREGGGVRFVVTLPRGGGEEAAL